MPAARRRLPLWVAMLALAACQPAVEELPAPEPATQQWSLEGLTEQPRLRALQRQLPADMGWEPGTTAWESLTLELPAEFEQTGAASPEALLYALLLAESERWGLGEHTWEQTLRVYRDPEAGLAAAAILLWGLQDDAIAGRDIRLHLRQRDDAWFLESAEQRHHCRRGVTADDLCL